MAKKPATAKPANVDTLEHVGGGGHCMRALHAGCDFLMLKLNRLPTGRLWLRTAA